MPKFIQNSFLGGVLTESLYGRTDTDIYYKGAKQLKNFIVRPYGGVITRPGFEQIIGLGSYSSTSKPRVFTYRYSASISYLVVFRYVGTEWKLYVYDEDGTELHNTQVTYSSQEVIHSLKDNQLGSSMYFCDAYTGDFPNNPVYKLDYDGDNWTWDAVDFNPPIFSDFVTNVTLTANDDSGSGETQTYRYKITCLNSETGLESLPYYDTDEDTEILSVSNFDLDVSTGTFNSIDVDISDQFFQQFDSLKIYKESGGIYGFIYFNSVETSGTGKRLFNDFGYGSPDVRNDIAPKEFTEFNDTNGYPAGVSFYQQRSAWYGMPSNKRRIYFSKLGEYENLTYTFPVTDLSGIKIQMENDITNLEEVNKLLVLSDMVEYKIDSSAGLSPYDISITKQSYWGSSNLSPIIIGSKVIFTEYGKKKVRDLTYDFAIDGYKGNDLSIFVPQFFYEDYITDWAYQKYPYACLWMVLNTGQLLSLTYDTENKVVAWSSHEIDGEVYSVSVLEVDGISKVFTTVKREDGFYLERMCDDIYISENPLKTHYLDSCKIYDGFKQNSGSLNPEITLGARSGTGVSVTASNGFLDGMVGRNLAFYDSTIENRIGLAEIKTVAVDGNSGTIDFIVEIDGSGTYTASSGTYALQHDTVGSFGQGTDYELSVLADNNYLGEHETNASSNIELDEQYSYIVAGLNYESILETLDLNVSGSNILFNYKTISSVYLKLEKSRQFKVGNYTNNLTYENYDIAPSDMYRVQKINIDPVWDRASNVIIKRDKPLPLNISCLMVEFEVGV